MAYKYDYDDERKECKAPKLKTNRSMWKLMILNILTCGIYSIVFFIPFSFDLDRVAPRQSCSQKRPFKNNKLSFCLHSFYVYLFRRAYYLALPNSVARGGGFEKTQYCV